MKNKYKQLKDFINKLGDKKCILIILSVIFVLMFILNTFTPMIADDFRYAMGLNKRIESFKDIVEFEIDHYMTWGGRIVSHTVAQIFLQFPKVIFNLLNSLMYVLLIYNLYIFARNGKKDKPIMVLLIHFILWFFMPVFGQTFLWLIGSCNYLWTTVLILSFINLYKKDNDDEKLYKIPLFFLFGLVSGWTNENTSFGLILITFTYFVIDLLKKQKINKIKFSGLLGLLLGFILLIISPGNFVREEIEFETTEYTILSILKIAIKTTRRAIIYLLPLIIIILFLINLKKYYKKKVENESFIYFLGSLGALYSMILSPNFPKRAWTGVYIFLILGLVILAYDFNDYHILFNKILISGIFVLFAIFSVDYTVAFLEIHKYYSICQARIESMEKSKTDGSIMNNFEIFIPSNHINPIYELLDLGVDNISFPNNYIIKYYDIDRLNAYYPETYNPYYDYIKEDK